MVVSIQRGTMGELIPLIEQMVDEAPRAPGVLTAALALAHAEADHTEDARRLLEEFAAADFDLPVDQVDNRNALLRRSRHPLRGPEVRRTDVRPARSLGRSVVASGSVTASGLVSQSLGGLATVLRRYDEADAYFAQSAAMSARMDAKFFAAVTDLLWGRMLAERKAEGDTEKARDLLNKAQAAAVAHGYGTSNDGLQQHSNS